MTAEKHKDLPKTISFDSGIAGPSVLFLGAIHGNETCGSRAIRKFVADIRRGRVVLTRGRVTLVPVCNPRAYALRRRQMEENLNRAFTISKNPHSYEARLANVLCPLVYHCDALIDIHSISSPGAPFVFLDYTTPENVRLAEALGIEFFITGWTELHQRIGEASPPDDTVAYANHVGKTALTVECGGHNDPKSAGVAYEVIQKTCKHFGIVQKRNMLQRPLHFAKGIHLSQVFFRRNRAEVFVRRFKHLDRVRKGEKLIQAADGTYLCAEQGGYVIMPNERAAVGEDWLYLGVLKTV